MPKKLKVGDGKSDSPDCLKPSVGLLCKLASVVVHVEEFLSPAGHGFDRLELLARVTDPEVVEWIKAMGPMAPRKRSS